MARIRTLKPTVWESEQLGEVSVEARLLFIGLITQADDEGRMKGSPKLVKSWVFPYDDFTSGDIAEWLRELSGEGLIHWFEVGGKQFIELPTWHKHQRVSHAAESQLPSHKEADSEVLANPPEDVCREGKGREGNKERKGKEPPGETGGEISSSDVRDVFEYWQQKLGKQRAHLTDTRREKIKARLKDGTTLDEMRQAIDGCAGSEFHRSNGHTDLELILRSRDQVEKFIERGQVSGRPQSAAAKGHDAARAWAAEAERLEALERMEAT